MKLTVDASIVVKWFVDEPLSEESRLLLAPRLDLCAPGILLSEFANAIWKKARRREIADANPFFDELVAISEIVNLIPDDDLIDRAARLAFEIGHPVYDCLYLACAEATESVVVTADEPLVKKAARRTPEIEVCYIGAPGVANRIEMAASALTIRRDQLEDLVAAYRTFDATHKHVVDDLRRETEGKGLLILTPEDQALYLNTPAYRRLLSLVSRLSEEERIDLLALGWFGAKLFKDWARSLEYAAKTISTMDHYYVAGYGHHWQNGYDLLTAR